MILFKIIGILLLIPLVLMATIILIFALPPTRKLLLLSVSRYFSKLAREGKANVHYRSWTYTNAQHQASRPMRDVNKIEVPTLDSFEPRKTSNLKDVGPDL